MLVPMFVWPDKTVALSPGSRVDSQAARSSYWPSGSRCSNWLQRLSGRRIIVLRLVAGDGVLGQVGNVAVDEAIASEVEGVGLDLDLWPTWTNPSTVRLLGRSSAMHQLSRPYRSLNLYHA
jgi:hypothetical protein